MNDRILSLISAFSFLLLAPAVLAQSSGVNEEITFIKDPQRVPDRGRQAELRAQQAWEQFKTAHPKWSVEFNESTGMPRRAYGTPIEMSGANLEEKARSFIGTEISGFRPPMEELALLSVAPAGKVSYVHFAQEHQGLVVLGARASVKFDGQGRAISFGADLYSDPVVDINPTITFDAAISVAGQGLSNVVSTESVALRLLPINGVNSYRMHLVHELMVNTLRGDLAGHYRCLVDAHTGELRYRTNEVLTCDHGDHDDDAGADVLVTGSIYNGSPLLPQTVVGLPELDIVVDGVLFNSDVNGFLASGLAGPVPAQYRLSGRYAEVVTNNVAASFTGTLNEGANTVIFQGGSNIRERSAYVYINQIHAHTKAVLPSFTGMDLSFQARLDLTTGDCNANYDGTGINFFAEGNNCRSLVEINDVVYHEYGHAVNGRFYQSQGDQFRNGGMNEGYADIWALSLTQNPILGLGINLDNDNSTVRRYDEEPKVYPADLTGEVHQNGEIIAGAWWDTYVLLGNNMPLTLELFAAAFPGLQAVVFNGNEGIAFRDVLLDVLQADDDDGDITNGTPNGLAIVEAFGIHGITLISDAELFHDDVQTAVEATPITINALVAIEFPATEYLQDVQLHYKVNNATDWTVVQMTGGGGDYAADIPAQPNGTVISYFLALTDIFDQVSAVTPISANIADPGLPYYIMVGFDLEATENADDLSELGSWAEGQPGDNATTGIWEFGSPVGSYGTVGDESTIVQPNEQHTTGGTFCWFTGNAASISEPLGDNDVDGGTTTLMGPTIDLTGLLSPSFSYWRWYTNNPPSGANPHADWWQVSASGDGGATWTKLEDTKNGERAWRRNVFRVQDVLGNVNSIKLKFNASDSIRPGVELNGGSLVEGAIDDIQLWGAQLPNGVRANDQVTITSVWPSPASDVINISTRTPQVAGNVRIEVLDMTGRSVMLPVPTGPGTEVQRVDVKQLASGQYLLRLVWEGGSTEQRFSVMR